MIHTLLIPLVGPMQAWGTRSRFDDRDTHAEPSKSGVLGLICAALGRPRSASIGDLAALRFGVRADDPGTVQTDYQTAQNVVRAGGSGATAVTSNRHYMADAQFLAGLEGSDIALLQSIETGLRNPRWFLALGRKSFPLTVPPYIIGGSIRENMSLEEALGREPWRPITRLRSWEAPPERLRLLVENPSGEHGTISDAPMSFADRQYCIRRVTSTFVGDFPKGDAWCTSQS